jgi:CheY-like chemotaxis protein
VEAVELARRDLPDVVLMDIRMPRMDGLEATRRIVALDQAAAVRVLVLTTFDLDEYVYQALRAGASGFLLKDTPPADLLAAIRVVSAGDALLAPSVTRRLIAEFARRPEPSAVTPAALAGLTEARAGGAGPGRQGPLQRRDRRAAGRERGHGQDPREPGPARESTPPSPTPTWPPAWPGWPPRSPCPPCSAPRSAPCSATSSRP